MPQMGRYAGPMPADEAFAGAPARAGRPRAKDVARLLGVSETAVSFALNGRPGISEETRKRILKGIDELGFTPSYAARALAGASTSTIGFVVARPPHDIGSEGFFLHLIGGIQQALSSRRFGLLFQVVPTIEEEIAVYRQWHADNRVDGVLLVDMRAADPRPQVLHDLGMVALVVGDPDPQDRLASISIDDVAATRQIADHLIGQGHRRIAYVAGDAEFAHVLQRVATFRECALEAGAEVTVVATDSTASTAEDAVAELLEGPEPPTAVVFENEVLAVGGVGVIQNRGLSIPQDVAVVSFEDSVICRALHPQITALHRETYEYGQIVAEQLLRALDGHKPSSASLPAPRLVVRASSVAERA